MRVKDETLKPWPPSAAHHHGFLRTGVDFNNDFPVAYVDDQWGHQGKNIQELYDQRKDEWMNWFGPRCDELRGHPCVAPFKCIFTFMGEVLVLAKEEGVDTSIITG